MVMKDKSGSKITKNTLMNDKLKYLRDSNGNGKRPTTNNSGFAAFF
jgi:hypothetical protein